MPAPFALDLVSHHISPGHGRKSSKSSVDALKDRRIRRSIVVEPDSGDLSAGSDVRREASSDWRREVFSALAELSQKLDDLCNSVETCQSGIADIKIETKRLQVAPAEPEPTSPKHRKPTFLRNRLFRFHDERTRGDGTSPTGRDLSPSAGRGAASTPVSALSALSPVSAGRARAPSSVVAEREQTQQSVLSDVSWNLSSPKSLGRSKVPETGRAAVDANSHGTGNGRNQPWDSCQGDRQDANASASTKRCGPFVRLASPSLPTLQDLSDEQPLQLQQVKDTPDPLKVEEAPTEVEEAPTAAELEEESLPKAAQNGVKLYIRTGSKLSRDASGLSRQASSLSRQVSGGSKEREERFERLKRTRSRSDFQKKLWTFLEDPEEVSGGGFVTRLLSGAITTMAFLPFFEIMDPPPIDPPVLGAVQNVFDCVFMLEVVLRFYSCPNRFTFFLMPYNAVDLVAGLVPFVVSMIIGRSGGLLHVAENNGSSRIVVWLVCSIPILRLLKLLRRFQSFHLLYAAFSLAFEALPVLLYTLCMLVLSFASLIYVTEPKGSITMPEVLWMTVVTIGTVGYGDIVPQSAEGKALVSVLIIVSSLYMAIPLGIVGKTFGDIWDDRTKILMLHRTRAKFTTTGYTATDIPSMFCSFDKDGDGELTLQEFMAMMRTLEIVVDDGRVVELFNSFDYNSDGTVDDEEFVRALFPSAYLQIYGAELGDDPLSPAFKSEEDEEVSRVI